MRIGKPLEKVLNAHASFGPVAYLIVLGNDSTITTNNTYSAGQSLPTEVLLKKSNK